MNLVSGSWRATGSGRTAWLALRLLWVAAQIAAIYYLGQTGALFFYQNF